MLIPYYHIDSFTTSLFAGNPAGVCILDAFLTNTTMKKIAAENRHSQTAFVVQRDDGDFDLRWFTPLIEDDLCGHATLAAAYVLSLRSHASWPVRFHTRSGVLVVTRVGSVFEMDFPAWPPQECIIPPTLLSILGLMRAHVMKPRDYMVVIENSTQVRQIRPDISALAQLDIGMGGVIVTAIGDDDIDYVSRYFAPSVGIDEDPVTGSIKCTLAPYWGARLDKRILRTRQLSARGGELHCTLDRNRVRIAGSATLYLHGEIKVDIGRD